MSDALIIIPTYNESENIVLLIEAIFSLPKDFHILVVDDGSPDGTAQLVKQSQETYNVDDKKLHILERTGKMGLGTAYIEGFHYALNHSYQYVLEMDADFSHNPKDVERLYASCHVGGNDLSIGSRYITGVNVVNWPMSRVLLSFIASKYVQFISGIHVHDTTAGFVCYKREVLEKLPLNKIKFLGYAFQIEMKFLAWKYGFKIEEIPIIFTERTRGKSKMAVHILREALFGVIQMTAKSWFRKYPKR